MTGVAYEKMSLLRFSDEIFPMSVYDMLFPLSLPFFYIVWPFPLFDITVVGVLVLFFSGVVRI